MGPAQSFLGDLSRNQRLFTWAVAISLLMFAVALHMPALMGGILVTAFAVGFLCSRRLRLIVFPAVLFFNGFLVARWGLGVRLFGATIWPVDWTALLLIGAVLVRQVLEGRTAWKKTGLERPVGLFLGGLALSLLGAGDLKAGLIGFGHILLFFLSFYAIVTDWEKFPVEKLLNGYFFWAILAILPAVGQFFATGGARSFGLSGVVLTDLILPVFFFQLVALTKSGGVRYWFFSGVLVLTGIASQTRGAWIGLVLLSLVWFGLAPFLKGRNLEGPKGWRVGSTFLKLVLLICVLLFLLVPFLGSVETRAEQLAAQSGTVYLRFFLWGLAIQLFLSHPLIGVGLGQFAGAVAQIPEMKNLSVYLLTRGLTAHNTILSSFVETGIVGMTTLLFLFWVILKRAWKLARQARTAEEERTAWGLFLSLLFVAVSSLYAGSWFWGSNAYEFMFFLALLVIFERQAGQPLEAGNAR